MSMNMTTSKSIGLKKLPAHIGDFSGIRVFICCSSFEARCMTIANELFSRKNQLCFDKAVLCNNRLNESFTKENVKKLQKVLSQANAFSEKNINADDPIHIARSLIDVLSRKSSEPHQFIIDITTFTHEEVAVIVKILDIVIQKNDEILLLYSIASDYSIGDEPSKKWLSKDVGNIRTIVGFPGILNNSYPNHLIIFVGFEFARAVALIEEFQPSLISLGCSTGQESLMPLAAKVNKRYREQLRKRCLSFGNVELFDFSSRDFKMTQIALQRQIELHKNVNTIITPMNSKLSTIGVAMTAIRDESIQLCYAQPRYYNFDSYSRPGTKCVILQGEFL